MIKCLAQGQPRVPLMRFKPVTLRSKSGTLPLSNCAPRPKFSDAKLTTIAMTKTFVEAVLMSTQI